MPMPDSAPRSLTVGDGKCFLCGSRVQVKASSSGYLCYTCTNEKCGCQHFSRSEGSNARLARSVTAWRKADYRAAYLPDDDEPDDEIPPDDDEPPPVENRPAPLSRPKLPSVTRTAPTRSPAVATRSARTPSKLAKCGACGTVGEKGVTCHGCGSKV